MSTLDARDRRQRFAVYPDPSLCVIGLLIVIESFGARGRAIPPEAGSGRRGGVRDDNHTAHPVRQSNEYGVFGQISVVIWTPEKRVHLATADPGRTQGPPGCGPCDRLAGSPGKPERGCRHVGSHDRPAGPTDAEVRRVAGRLAGRDLIPPRKGT